MVMRLRILANSVLMLAMLWLGAAQAHNTPQEEANKKLVRDFYNALDDAVSAGRIQEDMPKVIEKYIAVNYIQHQEGGKNGRAAMLEEIRKPRTAMPAPPAGGAPATRPMQQRATLVAIMAEGDRVIQVTSRTVPDPATGGTKPSYIWNMFRIENGMLAEHWDSIMPAITGNMAPPSAVSPSNK